MEQPFVSIIIPLHWGLKKENYQRFLRDLKKSLRLRYKKYGILIVTDYPVKLPINSSKIRYMVTHSNHPTSPAEKRDFVLSYVKGAICAFIDDDAYPDFDWLTYAVAQFKNPEIVAVGGPGVTPPEDTFWEKIGGHIIESYFCSGEVQYRFYAGVSKRLFVNDYPAYNLFVRTDILKRVGGYGSTFYGGEDTYLCLKLIKFGDILYDSRVVVYHHRRSFPWAHLKQIAQVGRHRGYFFKRYPKTSRSIIYILPITLTIGLVLGISLSIIKPALFLLPFLTLFLSVFVLGAVSVLRHNIGLASSIVTSFGIILTHMTYGIFFIRGLLTKNLYR